MKTNDKPAYEQRKKSANEENGDWGRQNTYEQSHSASQWIHEKRAEHLLVNT